MYIHELNVLMRRRPPSYEFKVLRTIFFLIYKRKKFTFKRTMANKQKCSNIYINPKFNDPIKSVIHINPKVHLNMAIHVNPKMVKNLSTCGIRQIQQLTRPPDILHPNIQKSIHVNPKLMEKLTNKVPDVVSKTQIIPKISQPQIVSGPKTQLNTKIIHVNKNLISPKNTPSKLVSLSKRKLVRVRPTVKTIVNNNNNNSSGSCNTKIIKSPRTIAPNQSKKFNKVDRRVPVVNKSKSLVSSTNTRYKIDRTGVQKKKISKTRTSPRKVAGR